MSFPKHVKTEAEKKAYLSLIEKGLIQAKECRKNAKNPIEKEKVETWIDEETTSIMVLKNHAFRGGEGTA